MGNPSLLLMDEPLEGLAPVLVDSLLAAFERLKREETLAMVLIEQHVRIALQFATEAIVLDRGTMVFSGDSSELLADADRLHRLIGVKADRAPD
jgi:branched-chain amino acid transport system ATP-binding protein